ncbi:hypothetical protein HOLleu_12874 [Holothuria leucospilota]|uniref:CCHC-type domain-containing protein n=1 Tax=Holothuria leucospilota TaxID=206669 RepID=A0A9Q1CBJ8_HOLLE|nr:hypothetical protein HOLleu_12874 [Holothuria leucospilota]
MTCYGTELFVTKRMMKLGENYCKNLDLTLQKCISLVQSAEVTAQRAKTMSHSSASNMSDVSFVTGGKYNSKAKRKTKRSFAGMQSSDIIKDCKFCGQSHAKARNACPASDAVCKCCGKVGHFAIKCSLKKSRKYKSIKELQMQTQSDSQSDFDTDVQ